MQVNVMSFKGLGGESLFHEIGRRVQSDLSRFGGRISRVEVLLMDGDEYSVDKACIIEARLTGSDAIAVQSHAQTFEKAVDKGAEKIESVIAHRDLGLMSESERRE